MTDKILAGLITVSVGASAQSKVDFYPERVALREVPSPSIKPVNVINSVPPVAFRQGHKWIEGEITAKSEAKAAIHAQTVNYLPPGAEAPSCPYLVIVMVSTDAGTITLTFTGAKFSNEDFSHAHDEEGLTTYKFIATSVVES